jgi:23S rRNA pseudouridine1911/1915/1917 synthase
VALTDAVAVELPAAAPPAPMAAEQVALEALFEDDHLLVVNKPAGLVVHPSYRHAAGTVLNALMWRAKAWPPPQRPSLVNRLDRLTSGLLLVAKTPAVHAALQRTVREKDYLAVVYGRVTPPRGRISLPLARSGDDRRRVVSAPGGAPSLTGYERLAYVPAPRGGLSVVRCRLETGRTHQIRVHLAAKGWPIVGDPVYGEPRAQQVRDAQLRAVLEAFPRQALHSWRASIVHPVSQQALRFEAPLPPDLAALLESSGLGLPADR